MSFAIVVGALLAAGLSIPWINILYGGITSFTLTAAAMAINDYYDYGIDVINEPKRPLPSGEVSKKEALIVTGILTVIGLAAAYIVSLYCFIFAFAFWIVMAAYSTVGKRSGLAGNFLVSACIAAPFLYGSLLALNTIQLNTLLFVAMASCPTLDGRLPKE
jgi:geranylgeranylglycerol-phosphate geranylgeranyltransferase